MTNNVTRITPGLIDSREVRSVNQDKTYTYYPNIDYMYGPYNSLEEAYAALSKETDNIGATALVKGKTVGVIEGGKISEYWFESDPADTTAGYKIADLVKKNSEQSVPSTNANIISLNDYITTGSKLPLNGIYIYNKTPISHMRTILGNGYTILLFCVEHMDGIEEKGDMYLHYEIDGDNTFADFQNVYRTDNENVPEWVLRAFGENTATNSYDGKMSHTDKHHLDELWTWYQTQTHSTTNA